MCYENKLFSAVKRKYEIVITYSESISFFKNPRSKFDLSINKFNASLDRNKFAFLNSSCAIISKSLSLSE